MKATNSPMLRLPPITCSPPSQITASVPRLEMKKISGKVSEVPRTTARFSCKRLLLALRYRSCSYGSRTNALTTRTPARFSCSTVFRLPSFCCTILKRGPILVKKKRKTPRMAGMINSATSASFQLVMSKIVALPMSITTALSNCRMPFPVKARTVSTSLVTRVINWPVWALS